MVYCIYLPGTSGIRLLLACAWACLLRRTSWRTTDSLRAGCLLRRKRPCIFPECIPGYLEACCCRNRTCYNIPLRIPRMVLPIWCCYSGPSVGGRRIYSVTAARNHEVNLCALAVGTLSQNHDNHVLPLDAWGG